MNPLLRILPNALSVARMAGGLFFFLSNGFFSDNVNIAVIVIAGLTDKIDGPLARKLGVATKAGKVLDTVSDKVFFFFVLSGLVLKYGLWYAAAAALVLFETSNLCVDLFLMHRKKDIVRTHVVSSWRDPILVAMMISYIYGWDIKTLLLAASLIFVFLVFLEYIFKGLKALEQKV